MQKFSFLNTVVLVNGVEITGWADGDDAISVKRRTDSASDKVGAAGDMMVSISADKSGEVAFKLLQTSGSNAYLKSLCDVQESAVSAFVPIQFQFTDVNRNDTAGGTSGYIKKPAEFTRGEKGAVQEWTIVVEQLNLSFGPNANLG